MVEVALPPVVSGSQVSLSKRVVTHGLRLPSQWRHAIDRPRASLAPGGDCETVWAVTHGLPGGVGMNPIGLPARLRQRRGRRSQTAAMGKPGGTDHG